MTTQRKVSFTPEEWELLLSLSGLPAEAREGEHIRAAIRRLGQRASLADIDGLFEPRLNTGAAGRRVIEKNRAKARKKKQPRSK